MPWDDDSNVATMPPAIQPDETDDARKRRFIDFAQRMPAAGQQSAPATPANTPTMPPSSVTPSSGSNASVAPSSNRPTLIRRPDPAAPTQPAMPPADPNWRSPMSEATPIGGSSTMPPAPTGPAGQRLADLQAQPRPELHGFKKVLDVIGQAYPFGRAIEANIPGSPQFYDAAVARAAGQAGLEEKTAEARQNLEAGAAKAQFDTPEKRQQYMEQNPERFEGIDDFQRNDWVLSGKFPTREQAEPKPENVQQMYADAVADAQKRGVDPAKDPKVQQLSDAITSLQPGQNKTAPLDKKIDEFVGPDNQRMNVMQRPDGSTYNVARGAVRQEAGTAGPGDVKDVAAGIISGDIPPDPAKWGYRDRTAIEAELKRNGFNLAQATNDWQATQKYLSSLNSTQQLRLRQAVTFTRDSLGIISDLYSQWKQTGLPTGFKDYNRAALVAASHLPGKTGSIATNLLSQISDLTSELGTVYKGGNSSTDESLKLAATNLQADWNDQTFQDAMARIDKNLRIRSNSIRYSQPEGSSGRYTPPSAQQGPQAGTVENGYRFKGGDAGKKENWEKVTTP